MGLRDLVGYLNDRCSVKAIDKQHLLKLRGKRIVIDISIYMYKFKTYDRLISNMARLINNLLKYNITPLVVFDGKPPPEKKATLYSRYKNRLSAELKYAEMQDALANFNWTEAEKEEMLRTLENLKKQIVRITEDDVAEVKRLLESTGVEFFIANGEADKRCAEMVCRGEAWACLSDDMDMFIYGCPRVIRHISLKDNTVIFYDTGKILQELGLTVQQLRQMSILAGTDYNKGIVDNMTEADAWVREYSNNVVSNVVPGFYNWVVEKAPKWGVSTEHLCKIDQMFDMSYNNVDKKDP